MSEQVEPLVRQWSLLFETHDGMTHPLRITFSERGSEKDARRHGTDYIKANQRWLKSLTDCYPTPMKDQP